VGKIIAPYFIRKSIKTTTNQQLSSANKCHTNDTGPLNIPECFALAKGKQTRAVAETGLNEFVKVAATPLRIQHNIQ